MDGAAELGEWEVVFHHAGGASGDEESPVVYARACGTSFAEEDGVVPDYFQVREPEAAEVDDFAFVEPFTLGSDKRFGVSVSEGIGSGEKPPPLGDSVGVGVEFSSKVSPSGDLERDCGKLRSVDFGFDGVMSFGEFQDVEDDFEDVGRGFDVVEALELPLVEGFECLSGDNGEIFTPNEAIENGKDKEEAIYLQSFTPNEAIENGKDKEEAIHAASDMVGNDIEQSQESESSVPSQVSVSTAEECQARESKELDDHIELNEAVTEPESADPASKSDAGAVGEGEKKVAPLWWNLPLDLLKYCAFKMKPVWSISTLVAFVCVFLLGRRMYRRKRKSKGIPLNLVLDEKLSQVATRSSRLNNALAVMKRLPPPGTAVTPWSLVPL